MVFSSSAFLFFFAPIALIGYFVCPTRRWKNIWLLVVSLFFYAWGEPVYISLMLASIAANWLFGLLIGRENQSIELAEQDEGAGDGDSSPAVVRGVIRKKALLVGIVVIDILLIGFFKYEGFLADNVNALFGTSIIPNLELPLPIGISFYTLQALSYVIDVYRQEIKPQRNILYLGMYVACFPQLIAGPIVRYQDIEDQIIGRKETLDDFVRGMRLFIVGLSKKVLLANTVAILGTKLLEMGGPSIGVVGAWGGIIAYAFQIFFDFSGYSDMAIGLGLMMGFKYVRNFNYPYISKSVKEFWRRWHISLSSFFRDYVYIPLGGSRVSKPRWVLNTSIVWAITGFWHGAAWNYVLWGVYYGVLLICENLFWGKQLEKLPAIIRHLYTILIFLFGWTFFWIGDMGQLVDWWAAMFGVFGLTGSSTFWELTVWEYMPVFAICILASTPLCPFIKEQIASKIERREAKSVIESGVANPRMYSAHDLCRLEFEHATSSGRAVATLLEVALSFIYLALFALCVMSIVSGSFNPFIYFQF